MPRVASFILFYFLVERAHTQEVPRAWNQGSRLCQARLPQCSGGRARPGGPRREEAASPGAGLVPAAAGGAERPRHRVDPNGEKAGKGPSGGRHEGRCLPSRRNGTNRYPPPTDRQPAAAAAAAAAPAGAPTGATCLMAAALPDAPAPGRRPVLARGGVG